jgi:hypothetical protein
MQMLLRCTTPSLPPPYTHPLVLACLQDRLSLAFFDPEYYNTFEETGTVEMIGQIHGLKKDGRNEFTLPERLPQGWAQFSKEKLIQLFIACPPEIQKKLHGHPKMWENPENYRGLDNDPQVLGIGVIASLLVWRWANVFFFAWSLGLAVHYLPLIVLVRVTVIAGSY